MGYIPQSYGIGKARFCHLTSDIRNGSDRTTLPTGRSTDPVKLAVVSVPIAACEEGGEAGEDGRKGTGGGAWCARNLSERAAVRALEGDAPLFNAADFFLPKRLCNILK